MEIVIVENNRYWLEKCVNIVESLLKIKKLDIKVIPFLNYNKELQKIIYDGRKKIYALDLQLDYVDGNEIAHEIRDQAKDWDSKIIMFSAFDRQKDIISDFLNVLVYVSKSVDFDFKFSKAINKAVDAIVENKLITIKEHGQEYTLIINDIVDVVKEKQTKYCIVKTKDGYKYRYRKSLLKINEELNFVRINNFTLINPTCLNKSKLAKKI